MTPRVGLYVLGMHAGIAVLMIVAATVLAILGDLDAPTVAALFGTAVGLAGGAASSVGSLAATVDGKALMSESAVHHREETLRHAIDGLSTSTPDVVAEGHPSRRPNAG